jgi:hypothetical protein
VADRGERDLEVDRSPAVGRAFLDLVADSEQQRGCTLVDDRVSDFLTWGDHMFAQFKPRCWHRRRLHVLA